MFRLKGISNAMTTYYEIHMCFQDPLSDYEKNYGKLGNEVYEQMWVQASSQLQDAQKLRTGRSAERNIRPNSFHLRTL
jgi:hypothetical protein